MRLACLDLQPPESCTGQPAPSGCTSAWLTTLPQPSSNDLQPCLHLQVPITCSSVYQGSRSVEIVWGSDIFTRLQGDGCTCWHAWVHQAASGGCTRRPSLFWITVDVHLRQGRTAKQVRSAKGAAPLQAVTTASRWDLTCKVGLSLLPKYLTVRMPGQNKAGLALASASIVCHRSWAAAALVHLESNKLLLPPVCQSLLCSACTALAPARRVRSRTWGLLPQHTLRAAFFSCSFSASASLTFMRSSMYLSIFSADVLPVRGFSAPTADHGGMLQASIPLLIQCRACAPSAGHCCMIEWLHAHRSIEPTADYCFVSGAPGCRVPHCLLCAAVMQHVQLGM